MNKFLQNFLGEKMEEKFASIYKKWQDFIISHPEIFCLSLLTIACLLFLFYGLGDYPLIDVDETRYAVMSRDLVKSLDWNSLMLNHVPFLEKPPLYFWLVGFSIKTLKGFSAFAVRFPIAILSAFTVFFTYYLGKKVISRKFGVISALTLLSSVFFLILSHIAIIDMVLTAFLTGAIYCGFLTHFCRHRNKKYYWWLFYLFIGLGFLAKGLLAFVIPVAVIFIYNFVTKTAREMFKPINILPGLIILFALVMPWHLAIFGKYGFQFIKEYFLIHHFGRLMGSEYIGRERPLLYFIPVFLLGFLPWTFVFIASLVDGLQKLAAKFKTAEGTLKNKISALFEVTTNEQKLILFSWIYFVVVFALFSSSSTKLPTYILPVFPAAALLTGYYWWVSDEKGEHGKSIYNLTLMLAAVFMMAAASASVIYYFLPFDIQTQLESFKEPTILALYLIAILMVLRLNTKRALSVFSSYIILMIFVIVLSVSKIFNLVYSTGENELVNYAMMSIKPNNASQLVTFDFAVKPSVMIKYEGKLTFLTDEDFKALDQLLKFKKGPTFVIIKNKNLSKNPQYEKELKKRLELIESGERYSLYVKDVNNEYNNHKKRKHHNHHNHRELSNVTNYYEVLQERQ